MTIPLFEAGMYSFLKKLEPGISFHQARRGLPSVAVIPEDTNDTRTASRYVVFKTNVSAAKKLSSQYPGDPAFDQLYGALASGGDLLPMVQRMENYPKIFKLWQIIGKERLYKFLTTDLRMPPPTFTKYIADVPESTEEHGVKFHNAFVMFPDNMSKRSREASLTMLEEVFDILNNHGLGFVFGCNIRFTPSSGSHGSYYPTVDEMRISPKAKREPGVIWTILHEFVHRYYRKFNELDRWNIVGNKFHDLKMAGVRHKDYERESQVALANQLFKPGMWVQYVGRKRDMKRYGPRFRIVSIDGGYGRFTGENDPENMVRFGMNLAGLLNPQKWKLLGVDLSGLANIKSELEMETEQWFPTNYSMRDQEEWFSDIVTAYLLGLLRGEPAEWVKEFIG